MASRVELVYGRSGSGKSTWCIKLARHFYQTKGLKTRLYIGDGGLETYESSGLIEAGVMEVLQYNNRKEPILTCQRICEGYWPKDPNDPNSPLIKPDFEQLRANYGLYIFEGLTAMADHMMSDKEGGMAWRAARGEKIGQDTPFVIMEGGEKFGGNPPSHFGFVQRKIEDNIERTRALPGWVQWTAHERKAEDYDTKDTEFGPDICGKALTTKIGARFGNSIHLHPAMKTIKQKDEVTGKMVDHEIVDYRAYTRKHFDPMQKSYVMYYANNRMPDTFRDEMPEFLSPPDPVRFYQILETAKKKAIESLQGGANAGGGV